MFRALEVGAEIDLDPNHLVVVERSLGTCDLPIGRSPARATRAWLLAFRDPLADVVRVYAFLGQEPAPARGPTGLLFRTEPPVVASDEYAALVTEGESMMADRGFMMEPVDLEDLEPARRAELLAALPFAGAVAPPPPIRSEQATPFDVGQVEARRLATVSEEVSLSERRAVEALGRILSLF